MSERPVIPDGNTPEPGAPQREPPQAPADPSGAAEPTLEQQLAALRHELALRDEFISTAAHELRNPLSPAYIQLEYLKETVRGSSAPIEPHWLMAQLEAMTARFDRFLDTLNRLLDASRLGAGHLVLWPERCDLVEVTRAVLGSAQRELHASGCTVELHAPEPVIGFWDRLRVEQIVGNLISNAARYGAGQPISIRIVAEAEAARLSVRDHGIGIAAGDLPLIFQRFERAGNVGRNVGFGIGLWIVAELCRAMGGSIGVDSELGKGATFTVTLPRKK
jgi:signal transduction histidine kinase